MLPNPVLPLPTKVRLIAYALAAGALSILVVLGVINQEQSTSILAATSGVLDVVVAVLLLVAARHITPDTWSSLRVALYVAASGILATVGIFGLVSPEAAALWLSSVDAVLQVVGIIVLGLAASKVPTPSADSYAPENALPEVDPPAGLSSGPNGPQYVAPHEL